MICYTFRGNLQSLWLKCSSLTMSTLLFTSSVASAADYYWTNPVSGNFATSSNWTPTGVPGINDTGIFDLGSAGYSVLGPYYVQNLQINNDTVSLTNNGRVENNVLIGVDVGSQGSVLVYGNDFRILPLASEASVLSVGVAGSGSLSIAEHGYLSVGGDFTVAQDAGSTGTVTVEGSLSGFQFAEIGMAEMRSATIGAGGEGSLIVKDGGNCILAGPIVIGKDAGSRGTVTADGLSSLMFSVLDAEETTTITIGEGGEGSLSVSGGAIVSASGPIVIGRDAGSRGTVTLNGSNSELRSSIQTTKEINNIVGEYGEGSLSVTHGAIAAINDTLIIGKNTGSQGNVNVDGSGSVLGRYGSLKLITVGAEGTGLLSFADGGRTNSGLISMNIGAVEGSHGAVTIDGTNTLVSCFQLIVGEKGSGSVSVTNGAYVSMDKLFIGKEAGSEGTVIVDGPGSILGNSQSQGIVVGESGKGSLSVTRGGSVTSRLIVGQKAGSEGTVIVDGDGSTLGGDGLWYTIVGENGNGSLSVTHGASALQGESIIGKEAGSEGTVIVDGPGSILGNSQSQGIVVGESGKGSLSITRGASVTSGLILGQKAESEGTVKIDGSSSIVGNNVTIGVQGNGSLSISNNSRMNVSSFDVGTYAGSGILTLDSGSSLNATNFVIGERGIVQIGVGSSVIADRVYNRGLLQVDGTLDGNVLQATGQISGNGYITGEVDLRGSSVAPGDSPGKLTVGSLDAANAFFEFEINSANGTAGGTTGWDLLSSLGGIRLFGDDFTIDLKSLDQSNRPGEIFDFDPTHDYHWVFMTGSSILLFDPADFHIDLSNFANHFDGQFSVSEVGNSLVLNYTAVPEAGTMVLTGIGFGAIVIVGLSRRRLKVGR